MEAHEIIAVIFVIILVAFCLFALATMVFCIFVNIQSHMKRSSIQQSVLERTVCTEKSTYHMNELTRITTEEDNGNFDPTPVPSFVTRKDKL